MKKILFYIDGLEISNTDKELLKDIFQQNEEKGLVEDSERIRILKSSLQFLGNPYLRTEELAVNTVDCSTLTSQSYWEGAQIGIPFIAQSQRDAADGEEVNIENILPGDIVVKFPTLKDSPDQTYNHVGLILGSSKTGQVYVIESNSRDGCVISTLEEFNPAGGFRRYIKNENITTDDSLHTEFNSVAKHVPKLSRLGARQYQKEQPARIQHKGIDIYVEAGSTVYAPIDGVITLTTLPDEKEPAIVIQGENIQCVLGNINVHKNLIGQTVKADTSVGVVAEISTETHMKYPDVKGKTSHLHFQIEGKVKTARTLNKIKIGDKTYYNGIYLAKLGLVKLPLKI